MKLGEIIRNYRRQNRISQKEFGKLAGCSQFTVNNAEYGMYTDKTKEKIARFLSIDPKSLDDYSDEKIVGLYIKSTREYLKFTQADMLELVPDSNIKILKMIEHGEFYVNDYSKNINIFKTMRKLLELFKADFLYTEEFKNALNNLKSRIGDVSIYTYPKFINNVNVYEMSFEKWVYLGKNKYPDITKKYHQSKTIESILYTKNNCIYSSNSLKIAFEFNFRDIKDTFENFEEVKSYVLNKLDKLIAILFEIANEPVYKLESLLNVNDSTLQRIFNETRITYTTLKVVAKMIKFWKDYIIKNREMITLISDLKFILYDYKDMPEFYNHIIKNNSAKEEIIKLETVKENEIEEPIKETTMEEETMQEINNIIEQKEIIINPFDGIVEESVNKMKEDIFDYIVRLLESDTKKAADYIKFVENLNLFSTEILRIKLNSKIQITK